MRRAISILVVLGAGVAAFAFTGASSDDSGDPTYKIQFDNAFGLVDTSAGSYPTPPTRPRPCHSPIMLRIPWVRIWALPTRPSSTG